MGRLEKRIREDHQDLKISLANDFFLQMDKFVKPAEFCRHVHVVCDDPTLQPVQKRFMLVHVLHTHSQLLSAEVVEKYLKDVEKDGELIDCLYTAFKQLEASYGSDRRAQLPSHSSQVRITRAALKAIEIGVPEDLQEFACFALEKFPNVPGKITTQENGKNVTRSHGLLKELEDLAAGLKPYPSKEHSVPQPIVEKTVIPLVFVERPRGQNSKTFLRNLGQLALAKQNENPECLVVSR